MPLKPDLVLGVDGGSSKTHLALADRNGRLRGFVRGPGTNHERVGFRHVGGIFARMLSKACRQAEARPGDVKAACFGLCGADLARDMVELERHAIAPLKLGGPVKVHNDAFIALFSDRFRRLGLAISSGSWHKWLGVNGARLFMIDGWGTRGIREIAILALSRACEGYRAQSHFTRRFARYLGFSDPRDSVERMYLGRGRRTYVKAMPRDFRSRYTRIPVWLARETARGSKGARDVIEDYAAELIGGAAAVIRATRLDRSDFDIVLSGSVLAGIPALRRAFSRRARASFPRARVLAAPFRPVRGALNYAARLAGWNVPFHAPELLYGKAGK